MTTNSPGTKIKLQFDSTLVGLAGNPFGKKTYEDQVKRKAKVGEDIILVIPARIQRIASSFIQGFFKEWLENVGVEGIREHVTIECENPKIKELIFKNLV